MSNYSAKLKHPLWQRKRLEILDRADFCCEKCGATEITLHVHHGYYEKGLEPWEYDDQTLHCLCEDCHKTAQFMLGLLYRATAHRPVSDLGDILDFVDNLSDTDDMERTPCSE